MKAKSATPGHHSIPLVHSLLRVLPLLVIPALWIGCQQPNVAPQRADITGTYTLVSVDGQEVPASVSHEGAALQVRSGEFVIGADGTCKCVTVFVPPSGNEVRREVNATYTTEGSALRMQWQGAGVTTGSVDGDSFTMDNEGMIFTYQRSGRS